MPTDTFCSDTFYVHTDPGSLPSFAEECSFGNCLRIHTTKKKPGFEDPNSGGLK